MSTLPETSRRSFLVATTTGIAVAGTSACQSPTANDRQLVFRSWDDALRELDRLAAAPKLSGTAVWTWAQTLNHCAQSIEFSLTGFPQAKPAVFQRSVGALAFQVFSWRGRMSHDLAEPIPGAPALDAGDAPATAMTRLRKAIADFRAQPEPFKPHFAYGDLNKSEYELAHALHLANHLSGFDTQA